MMNKEDRKTPYGGTIFPNEVNTEPSEQEKKFMAFRRRSKKGKLQISIKKFLELQWEFNQIEKLFKTYFELYECLMTIDVTSGDYCLYVNKKNDFGSYDYIYEEKNTQKIFKLGIVILKQDFERRNKRNYVED